MRTLFLCSCILISTLVSLAQSKSQDSIRSVDSLLVRQIPLNQQLFYFKDNDSIVDYYQPFNLLRPLQDVNFLTSRNNGNSGNSYFSLRFQLPFNNTDEIIGHNQLYYLDLLKMKNLLFPLKQYTEICYSSGAKNDNYFYVTHGQKIKKNLFLGFKYNIVNSTGFYNYQLTNHRAFSIYALYRLKNYRLYVSADYGHYRAQENGGFTSVNGFQTDSSSKSFIYSVKLAKANTEIKKSEYRIDQSYRLTKDTIGRPYFSLFSSSKLTYLTNRFRDYLPDSAYYAGFNIFNANNFDTISVSLIAKYITNEAGVLLYNDKRKDLEIKASLENQIRIVKYNFVDTTFNLTSVNFSIKQNTKRHQGIGINAEGKYFLIGNRKADYESAFDLYYNLGTHTTFGGLLTINKNAQPLFINKFRSEVYNWDRTFVPTQNIEAKLYFDYKKLRFSAGSNYVSNLVYFDGSFNPVQCLDAIQVSSLEIDKTFKFGRFEIENSVLFQKTNNENVLSIPLYTGYHSVNYFFRLLHGLLDNKIGVEVVYNASYYPNAYLPIIEQYYVQRNTKLGDYPMLNFYAFSKFKNAQFFVKLQHLNAGFMGNDYFVIPGYAYPGRSFKFGILWKFLN